MERVKLKLIRVAMDEALKGVGEKFGMELTVGRITFGENNFTAKVEGAELSEDGRNLKLASDWDMASKLGLVKREWLGQDYGGYKIIGFDFKKRTRNIICEKGGKQYSADTNKLNRDMALIETKKLIQKG